VLVCRGEACQSMGAHRLVEHAEQSLGTALGTTSDDGRFTLEEVFCLGNCALSPAVMTNATLHGRVSPSRFDAVVGGLATAESP
jgi:formate dehydrogenase subunit gamma